jgi:UDP-N-acetyl-D-glucosamine dehydrogenase
VRELAPTASDARLAEAIETRSANCAIVGLGHVGTAVATALLDGGFSVHGLDRSPAAVLRFIEAFAERDGSVTAGTDPEALAEADVVHVAVPVECLGRDRPDLEALRSVAHDLRRHRRPARLTVIHSTVPPGTTRWFANELADAPEAGSAFVAHSPERLQPGNAAWTVANTPHAVAGVDEVSTTLALALLRRIVAEVVPATAPEVTELAKLMENAFIAVGVALAGDIARLAHAVGVAGTDVARVASSKPFAYYPFFPGPGVGGHCLPNDLAMLASVRREHLLVSPLLDGAAATLDELPAVTVRRLSTALAAAGRELRGATVLLIGLGFKVGSSDVTNTPARDIVRLLRAAQAVPFHLDPAVRSFTVDELDVARIEPEDLTALQFDAALLLAGDRRIDGEPLTRAAAVVVDASGGRAQPTEVPGAQLL